MQYITDLRVAYLVVIFFVFINGFFLPFGINSTIVAPLLFVFYIPYSSPRFFSILRHVFLSNVSLLVFGAITLMIVANLIVLAVNSSLDFSNLKVYIGHLYLHAFILLFYTISVDMFRGRAPQFEIFGNVFVLAFIVQSLIQILAFFSPQLASFVHLFYPHELYEKMYLGYNGSRGLSMSGSPGWGLSVGYAVAFLALSFFGFYRKRVAFLNLYLMSILFIGSLFAGRTALVGLALGLLIYLFGRPLSQLIKEFSLFLALAVVIFILSNLAGYSITTIFPTEKFYRAFEFLFSYIESGKFETSSTNRLIEMWGAPIGEDEYFFGSGLKLEPDGSGYYQDTDVGYLRTILYGGLFWLSLKFLFHLSFLVGLFVRSENRSGLVLLTFIFFLGLLLELKAEAITYNKYFFISYLSFFIFYFLDGRGFRGKS